MKTCLMIAAVAALFICGCSSKLNYSPEAGSPNVPVSAVHHLTADRLYVYVASDGVPVESATLVRSDGGQLSPASIHRPSELSGGMKNDDQYSVSGGMYGGSTGIAAGGTSTFGSTNFGAGGTFGSAAGDARLGTGTVTSRRDLAQTIVIFPADHIGPGPWRFRVKIENYPDVSIVLPNIEGN